MTTTSWRRTHLVLYEVAQSFDDDGAAALLFGVSGLQSHDVLGICHQMLNLPLVFHDLLSLPLEKEQTQISFRKNCNLTLRGVGVQIPRRLPHLQSSEELQEVLQRRVLASGELLAHHLVLFLQAAVGVVGLLEELLRSRKDVLLEPTVVLTDGFKIDPAPLWTGAGFLLPGCKLHSPSGGRRYTW